MSFYIFKIILGESEEGEDMHQGPQVRIEPWVAAASSEPFVQGAHALPGELPLCYVFFFFIDLFVNSSNLDLEVPK